MGIEPPGIPKGFVDRLKVLGADLERTGVGAVHREAGSHLDKSRGQLLGAGVLSVAVGFRQQIQVKAEGVRLTGKELRDDVFSFLVYHAGERAPPAGFLVSLANAPQPFRIHHRAA